MKSKRYAKVNSVNCVACGECVKFCPLGAIHIEKGIFAAINPEICVGCGKCSLNCPANAIGFEQRESA